MGNLSEDAKARFVVLVATILFLALAAVSIYETDRLFRDRRRSRESQSWPSVPGQILDAAVESSHSKAGTSYYPRIHYRYVVGGKTFSGDRVSFNPDYGREGATAAVAKYQPGSAASVWYDPSDPRVAALDPTFWDGDLIFFIIIPVDVLLSLLALLFVAVSVLMLIPGVPFQGRRIRRY